MKSALCDGDLAWSDAEVTAQECSEHTSREDKRMTMTVAAESIGAPLLIRRESEPMPGAERPAN
jgi:hypothetical protein